MKEAYNPRLKALVLEVLENQIRDQQPAYVQETLNRLVASGWSEKKAREAMAAVLLGQIYYVMKDNRPFDDAKYKKELDAIR